MKNILLVIICFGTFISTSNAQIELENFYGGFTLGWAQPIGQFKTAANGGLCYNLEAGYRITDNLGVGAEYASSAVVNIDPLGLYSVSQYLVKANYRLLDRKFSPYGALAMGYSNVAEPDVTTNQVTRIGQKRGGFATVLEAGIDVYGVILAYRFNYGGSTPKEPEYNIEAANLPVTMHQFVVGYIYKFRSY